MGNTYLTVGKIKNMLEKQSRKKSQEEDENWATADGKNVKVGDTFKNNMANNEGPCRCQYKLKKRLGLRKVNEPMMGRGIRGQAA